MKYAKRNLTIVFVISVLLQITTQAQRTTLPSMLKAEIGLHGIGISYEPALGNDFTLEMTGGVGGIYELRNDAYDYSIKYGYDSYYSGPGIFYVSYT
ncbi:MAG: hypothetical protein ACK5NK_00740 [Niabella sp.]